MPTDFAVTTDSAPADLQIPSGADYAAWRKTGIMPSNEESAPSKEVQTETPAEQEESAPQSDTAAASEPAPKQEQVRRKTPETSERRWTELLSERKTLRDKVAELERQLSERSKASDSPRQDSQPAKAAHNELVEPKIDDLNEKGEPKYKTYDEYLAAVRKYDRDVTIREFETRNAQARQSEHERVISQKWGERVNKAIDKYPDFIKVALNENLQIPKGSLVDLFTLDSDHGADVLYELAKNDAAELGRITDLAKTNPLRAHRELLKIEQRFSAAPAPKKVTQAPPPPKEVTGKGTTSADEVEQAVKEEDQSAYMAAANRRDIMRRRGK